MSDKPAVNAPPSGGGQHFAPRSEAFQRFMAAPLIVASVLMVATATLAFLAWRGGTAEGDRLEIELSGSCGADAIPLLSARMDEMGLGDPKVTLRDRGVTIVATMPGSADDEATHVPAMLARAGRLVAGSADAPVFTDADVELAQIRLDESGLPYTWLELSPAALTALEAAATANPEGEMSLSVDAIEAPARPHSKPVTEGGIRLLPGDGVTRARMRVAADHAIVLTHGPLPCPMTVASARKVDSGSGGR